LLERDIEFQHLKHQMDQMEIEYQTLLDIKIGLDREIATYRTLLESEEDRLKIPTISMRVADFNGVCDGGATESHTNNNTNDKQLDIQTEITSSPMTRSTKRRRHDNDD